LVSFSATGLGSKMVARCSVFVQRPSQSPKYVGPTGGLLTAEEQCAFTVQNCFSSNRGRIKMQLSAKLASAFIAAAVPFSSFGSAAHAACNPAQLGSGGDCPVYTAPASTAVPRSMDGSMVLPSGGVSVVLFNGVVPPNGFMVQINVPSSIGAICNVNDNGPA